MLIGILVCGQPVPEVARRRGDYERFIREGAALRSQGAPPGYSGPRWKSYDVRTDAPLPRRRDADAFVITGSSSSVTERAQWMLRLEELVRAIVDGRTPLLGICFGHQIIAQAVGGTVSKNPRGREIGTVRVTRIADDPLFSGLPRVFDVNATHVDAVVRLPPRARVLATTDLDPVAAFRVDDRAWGVQFHPEFDGDVIRGYLEARAHLVRREGGDPDALRARVHSGTRGRDILQNFVRVLAS